MGRRCKCTPKVIEDATKAIGLGLKIVHAAQYAGISKTSWYDWVERGLMTGEEPFATFAEAVTAGQARGRAACMARIVKAAINGSWQADAWILERSHGYSKTAEITVATTTAGRQRTPEEILEDINERLDRAQKAQGEQ